MNRLNLRWQTNQQPNTQTTEETAKGNPILAYILTQKKIGTSKKVIIENLMRQGYPYRNIKNAYNLIDKLNENKLDWRSPTAINETSRMIRKDIRAKKITYVTGMKILINARNNLKTYTTHPRDKRVGQLNQEIRTTKKLLMHQYANPWMQQQFRIVGAKV